MLICDFVTLAIVDQLPMALALLVVSRDLMIIGAVILSWLLDRPMEINPLAISKANTFAQIGLIAALLAALAFGWPPGSVGDGGGMGRRGIDLGLARGLFQALDDAYERLSAMVPES